MRSASVQKEVRELQLMADSLDNGWKSWKKQAAIVRRAIRMLQDQQAQLVLAQRQPIDLRLSKVEDNARMAKVGRSYLKTRKSLKTPDGSLLESFHGCVDELIAKN